MNNKVWLYVKQINSLYNVLDKSFYPNNLYIEIGSDKKIRLYIDDRKCLSEKDFGNCSNELFSAVVIDVAANCINTSFKETINGKEENVLIAEDLYKLFGDIQREQMPAISKLCFSTDEKPIPIDIVQGIDDLIFCHNNGIDSKRIVKDFKNDSSFLKKSNSTFVK